MDCFKWIKHLLQNITACVKMNSSKSRKWRVKNGIPQSGVVSQTLFCCSSTIWSRFYPRAWKLLSVLMTLCKEDYIGIDSQNTRDTKQVSHTGDSVGCNSQQNEDTHNLYTIHKRAECQTDLPRLTIPWGQHSQHISGSLLEKKYLYRYYPASVSIWGSSMGNSSKK